MVATTNAGAPLRRDRIAGPTLGNRKALYTRDTTSATSVLFASDDIVASIADSQRSSVITDIGKSATVAEKRWCDGEFRRNVYREGREGREASAGLFSPWTSKR